MYKNKKYFYILAINYLNIKIGYWFHSKYNEKKKYLDVSLTKELIDLLDKSYKTLLREIKDGLNEMRENSHSLFRGSHCENGNSIQTDL